MKKERPCIVKEQFETDFETYDQKIRYVLPDYEEMQNQLVEALDFPKNAQLSFLDLGVGTGYGVEKILAKFPKAKIVGIDVSPKMMGMAKSRLKNKLEQLTFIEADMIYFKPTQNYDAIIGVLSIHHLTDYQKQELYKKAFKHLNLNGVFAIGDLKIGETEEDTKEIERNWKKYLISKFDKRGADEWLKIYQEEDVPVSVGNQIQWLGNMGFEAKVKWQKRNLAVIIGKKLHVIK